MPSNNRKEKDFDVGYCKPPRHGQFRPGQSGNSKGRPKGATNLPNALFKALNERVVVNENGERKTISKLDAAFKQLANKAASGDARATKLVMHLLENNVEAPGSSSVVQVIIEGADAKL